MLRHNLFSRVESTLKIEKVSVTLDCTDFVPKNDNFIYSFLFQLSLKPRLYFFREP